MDAKKQLLTGLNQVVTDLKEVGSTHLPDSGQISLTLEALSEAALLNSDILLEVIDLMNQSRQQLQDIVSPSYRSYRAPIVREEGQHGRPKFHISEEHLLYFKGVFYVYFLLFCLSAYD